MSLRLTVIIEKDADGYFAQCPELEGCYSQGDNFDEAMRNIREAIELYLETMTKEERQSLSHKEVYTTSLDVNVA